MSEEENQNPTPAETPTPEAAEKKPEPVAEAPKAEEKTAPKAEAKDAPKAEKKDLAEGEEAAEGEEGEGEEKGKPKAPSAADLLKSEVGEIKVRKAKGSKNISAGVVHILATFNNTKVTFTDRGGNVISWSSSGKCNFRGSRKSTAYAAQVVTQDAGRVAMSHGLKEVEVRVKGPGMGRDSAIRAIQAIGLMVTAITDVTPVPHNGCRSPKRRRV